MKVAILCGGKGFRMREVTGDIPKPLAEVCGKPILWHIMNLYKKYGFDDFILLIGYKGDKIKEYFINEEWRENDFILDTRKEKKKITYLQEVPKWKITFIDTGAESMTGSRIKQAEKLIDEENFMLTYGDGIADINLKNLYDYHINMGKIATLTGINGKSQYGLIQVENGLAESFLEKPEIAGEKLINGGFFVLNKRIFEYIEEGQNCIFERAPLMKLAEEKQLAVYKHDGYWSAIDTYKDLVSMNEDWCAIKAKVFG